MMPKLRPSDYSSRDGPEKETEEKEKKCFSHRQYYMQRYRERIALYSRKSVLNFSFYNKAF